MGNTNCCFSNGKGSMKALNVLKSRAENDYLSTVFLVGALKSEKLVSAVSQSILLKLKF